MYLSKIGSTIDACSDDNTTFPDSSIEPGDQYKGELWPKGDFDVPKDKGADGCTFHGDGNGPGKMTCGNASLDCAKDPILDKPGEGADECSRQETVYPDVVCNVPIDS